ncbi:MAG: RagB/SusD family nutrient uptake outer membrane protein [Muribaculum sp.]|nr:RagB/SusD family nutrient uptake outer membrane protein [Muribaculaceae bacterium]MCM1081264.1 RagB/SusD family nutrient uptake outer membrane protein [Muribaculum sp.]
MKTNKIFIPLVALGLAFTACDKMDYIEVDTAGKDFTAEKFENVAGFMTQLYKAIEYDFGNFSGGAMSACATDEAEFSRAGNAIEDFYNGSWSSTNAKNTQWNSMFKVIRAANNYLDEFTGLKFEDYETTANYQKEMHRYENYQYEARFLRAYFYFILVRQYGGVPIMKHTMSAAEANSLARNTSDEVFEFILDELTEIKDLIIEDYSKLGDYSMGITEGGRADKYAVLALRARAAMYWASPLFNPTNDQERWHTAAIYNNELIKAAEAGGKKLASKYEQVWDPENYKSPRIKPEMLFGYRYYKDTDGDNYIESNSYPVGIEGGNGGNCPTQNLVDAYTMKNGKSIDDPTSGYDENNPYKNRDPRLEVTIAVNGDKWPSYSGAPNIETFVGGKNGQPVANATTTGYYLKKLCNGAINLSANSTYKKSFHVYQNFRMGGAYLDYAECIYRWLGDSNKKTADFEYTALEAVNKVRKRAKVSNMTATGDEFWKEYKNERMVELAFEGHRFWDVRRWKEADKYFTSITRMVIEKDPTDDTKFTYRRQVVNRQWEDKMYLFPIPLTEIMKNPNLKQNDGWL